jgi:hypothetical protein
MIKFKLEEVLTKKQTIKDIICNMCGKSLGNEEWNVVGGSFFPSFSYGSKYDLIENDTSSVDMCDDCWDNFFESMMFDPRSLEK